MFIKGSLNIGFLLLAIYLILIGIMAIVPSIAIPPIVMGIIGFGFRHLYFARPITASSLSSDLRFSCLERARARARMR